MSLLGSRTYAQSVSDKVDKAFSSPSTSLYNFARIYGALPSQSSSAYDIALKNRAVLLSSIYDYAYEQAYKQALEDVKNNSELPFSNLSEEKKTELMIKNCPAPVQTPDFKGEYESGGVPKGFKGFN